MSQPVHERIAALALDHLSHPPRGDDPVVEWASPDTLREAFAATVGLDLCPDEPAHDDDALVEAVRQILRYSVHTSHPRFVNQNFAGPTPISTVGDWLGAALNTTAATFEAAPVFTLMEHALLTRLAAIAGFPTDSSAHGHAPGLLAPGGSTALLYALQLARHRADPAIRRVGDRTPWAIFVSEAGHYSTVKSAALLGMGTDAVVKIATDPSGAMRPEALDRAIAATARTPLAVVATAGTTVTAAFDPIAPIADLCERHGLWLHVDGAWGGSAVVSPRWRHLLAGVERADSLLWNLHKLLGVTQQCSALLLREPDALGPCFATGADYLFQADKLFAELDTGDRHFQCARRVDALKAWLAWKATGEAGLAARVDHAVALADHARARVASSDDLCALVPGSFTNVCFTWVPPELRPLDLEAIVPADRDRLHALQPRVKARMQREGTAMIGYQPVHGLNCFRLIFNAPTIDRDEVDRLLDLVRRYSVEEWA